MSLASPFGDRASALIPTTGVNRDVMQGTHVHRASSSMGDLTVCTKRRNPHGGSDYPPPPNLFPSYSRASQACATHRLGWTTKISLFLPRASFRLISAALCSPRRITTRPMIILPLKADRVRKHSSCRSERNLPNPINLNSLQYPPSPSFHLFGSPPSLANFIHHCRC